MTVKLTVCFAKKILALGEGKYFSDSYRREDKFHTDQEWEDWCTETREHCTIGTFLNGELIGIMGIVMYGLPTDNTAEWEATWLEPRYRRSGIARLAYEKVRQWTQTHDYKTVVILIREDNHRSREIREKQGAVYTHTKHNEIWADGSIAAVHYFILPLTEESVCEAPTLQVA